MGQAAGGNDWSRTMTTDLVPINATSMGREILDTLERQGIAAATAYDDHPTMETYSAVIAATHRLLEMEVAVNRVTGRPMGPAR